MRLLSIALICSSLATLDAFAPQVSSSSRFSTAVHYRDEHVDTAVAQPLPAEKPKTVVVQIKKKPTIYPLSSLQELYDFLEEDDDRLTAIK